MYFKTPILKNTYIWKVGLDFKYIIVLCLKVKGYKKNSIYWWSAYIFRHFAPIITGKFIKLFLTT